MGENAAREGLSLELGGLIWPEPAVEIGVRPRREISLLVLLFQAEGCDFVLLEPEDVVGLVLGREGSLGEEEEGGKLIDTARTLRRSLVRGVRWVSMRVIA